MKQIRGIFLAMACLLTTACTTPYQEGSTVGELMLVSAGGYRTTQVQADLFSIEYAATPVTPDDTIVKYMQYRCATLALEMGYDGFSYKEPISAAPPRPQTKKYFYARIVLRKHPYPEGETTIDAQAVKDKLESFVKSQ